MCVLWCDVCVCVLCGVVCVVWRGVCVCVVRGVGVLRRSRPVSFLILFFRVVLSHLVLFCQVLCQYEYVMGLA